VFPKAARRVKIFAQCFFGVPFQSTLVGSTLVEQLRN